MAEGPSSMLRSMLRSLSTRRTTGTSLSGTPGDQQSTPSASAAGGAGGQLAQAQSVGGAPSGNASTAASSGGVGSGGVSPFIPSRASSNHLVTGGPASSADSGGSHPDDGASVQGPAGGASLRRAATHTGHHSTATSGARIGLPQLSVRPNGVPGAAGGGAAGAGAAGAGGGAVNGYGSAVVSPAGRRRSTQVAQPMRMSDAGIVGVPGQQGRKSMSGETAVPPVAGGQQQQTVRPTPPTEAPPAQRTPNKGLREAS